MLRSVRTRSKPPAPNALAPALPSKPAQAEARAIGEYGAMPSTGSFRPGRLWFVVLLVSLLLGLIEAAQAYWLYSPEMDGPPFTAPRALGLGLGLWSSWALLWLIAFPLARRFPLGSHHWLRRLALHTTASLVCAALKALLDYPAVKFFFFTEPEKSTLSAWLRIAFISYSVRYVLFYWAMIGVSHALDYYGKYRDGELRTARLETGLARARLQLLKTQLQPHFLFNTLNAISALVHIDVESADRMLARLGDLLRLALEDFGLQEAPLSREVEILRSYLDIEQARLGSRLHVEWLIDADTTDALVPTFLLQPLVENAIRHGIAPRTEAGRLEIRARRDGDLLHLEVRDDGPGLPAGACNGGGVGLSNTRARLFHLYRAEQQLEIHNDPQGGCVARVTLPFRELCVIGG